MSIEFTCSHCRKVLKAADDKAGKRAKCPGCGRMVTIPFFESDNASGSGAADEFDFAPGGGRSELEPHDTVPFDQSGRATKACPMCGEQIKVATVRCRYCGEKVGEVTRKAGLDQPMSGLAVSSLVLGIVGLVFTLCCACINLPASGTAVGLGLVAMRHINHGQASGKGLAIAGIVCGAIGLLIFIILMIVNITLIDFNQFEF